VIFLKRIIPVAAMVLFNLLFMTAQKVMSFHSASHYGLILPHSVEVQNTKGAHPFGFEAGISFTDTSERIYNLAHCMATGGLNLMYFDYDSRILGRSVGLNYFLEPSFRLNQSWRFCVRGQFGLVYLTRPYHPVNNPTNMSYSTHLSFFLGISSGISWQLNKHWQTALYANFLHASNGGLKDPNKGINWPTAQLQVNYFPESFEMRNKRNRNKINDKSRGITLYGLYTSRLLNTGDKVRYSVYGLGAEYFFQIAPVSGLIGSAELYNDHSLKEKLNRLGMDGVSSIRAGIAAGHVFLLGKFQFSQQIGYYVYSPSKLFDQVYHRWGLNYCHNSKLVIGISLKAHRHVANFTDVRIGYRINRK
jgi:hypothetical protein